MVTVKSLSFATKGDDMYSKAFRKVRSAFLLHLKRSTSKDSAVARHAANRYLEALRKYENSKLG